MSDPIPHNSPCPRTDAELADFLAGAPEPVQMCADDDAETSPLFTTFEAVVLGLVDVAAIALFVASWMGVLV